MRNLPESLPVPDFFSLSGADVDTDIVNVLPDGVALFDQSGVIMRANPAFAALVQRSCDALVGVSVHALLGAACHETVRHALRSLSSQRPLSSFDIPGALLVGSQGNRQRVDLTITPCSAAGSSRFLLLARNQHRIQSLQEQLHYQSNHDSVTGLINRWAFMQKLGQALQASHGSGRPVALLMLDIDHFKDINDSYGHGVGDHVLAEIADRTRHALRPSDLLARLGGDEFAVLLTDLSDPYDAFMVAERLMSAIGRVYQLQAAEVHPTVSIGIGLAPFDAQDAPTLVRFAEMAMYQSKEAGRNTVTRYAPTMAHAMNERMLMIDRLRLAIETDSLTLHYQPQVDISTGRVVSVEALLRWFDPELGNVPPDRFIHLAESSGLMPALGDWVLETACRQLAEWSAQGLSVRIAINLSAQQFHQEGLYEHLDRLVLNYGLSPDTIELELTESRAMENPDYARSIMQRLSDRGFKIAIDDFGTGHSSLAYLKTLPIDRVKIDRSFVSDLQPDTPDASLLQGIIGLVHALGKEVVAEGVETASQLGLLQQQGCNSYQGWFFSKAISPEDFIKVAHSA